MFVTQHRSLPDLRGAAQRLAAGQLGGDFPASFEFDSLRELPASLPWLEAVGAAAAGVPLPQVLPPTAALEEIAHDLRKALGLTLFGFDAIKDSRTGAWTKAGARRSLLGSGSSQPWDAHGTPVRACGAAPSARLHAGGCRHPL